MGALVISSPQRVILPLTRGSRPERPYTNSLCPFPSIPAIPTISPALTSKDTFFNSKVVKEIEEFKEECDIIVSNRLSKELFDVEEKVYTRDLFNRD